MNKIEFLNEERIELAKKNFEKFIKTINGEDFDFNESVKEYAQLANNIKWAILMNTKEGEIESTAELLDMLIKVSKSATQTAFTGIMLECIDISSELKVGDVNE